MASNIEIKARARNFAEQAAKARAIADQPPVVSPQEDVFFHIPVGRFKLRVFSDDKGELIWYERPDTGEARRSLYERYPTREPRLLQDILSRALGIRGKVVKVRTLFMKGSTRIHFDDVEGLGQFIELEYVMDEHAEQSEGDLEIRRIMDELGIRDEDLVGGAYMDLLEGKL